MLPPGVEPWTFLMEQAHSTQNRQHQPALPSLLITCTNLQYNELWVILKARNRRNGALSVAHNQHAAGLVEIVSHARDHWNITFSSVDPFNEPMADWWSSTGSQLSNNRFSGHLLGCHSMVIFAVYAGQIFCLILKVY